MRKLLRWAGGKTRMLRCLLPRVPRSYGVYHEPFLGGGALFFSLGPKEACLSDANHDLIQLYRVVQQQPDDLVAELSTYPYEREFYTRLRALDPEQLSPVRRAARMLYLNRTCFNGLYRVNKNGQFNVPFGSCKNKTVCDEDAILRASWALHNKTIACQPFTEAIQLARSGDFVYLDPPYYYHDKGGHTAYTPHRFGESEHRALADLFCDLTKGGVLIMLSLNDVPLAHELYGDYLIERFGTYRSIAADKTKRWPASELIIRNYPEV